jgi:hypothetical protein
LTLFDAPVAGEDRSMDELTHQCPYCDLRFSYHNEITDHVLHDHPERADVVIGLDLHEIPR